MRLPTNRDELRQRWEAGERFEFFLFYGHKPPLDGVDSSCLSQWFQRVFVVDGVEYATAEHWMMAEKARLFSDEEMLQEILDCAGPREAKAFGRKVSDFDGGVWDEHKYEIVKRGNFEKFSQHDDMGRFLKATASYSAAALNAVAEDKAEYKVDVKGSGSEAEQVREPMGIYKISESEEDSDGGVPSVASNVILVEAAGRDTVWGIGLGQHNPKSQDPFQWRGLNLLGFALTEVRELLISR